MITPPARDIGHRNAPAHQKDVTPMSLITPPLILEKSALFAPMVSRLKPTEAPSFFAKVLATAETVKTPAWKSLEKAVDELGNQNFGRDFPNLVKGGQFRSPIRLDVSGKDFPDNVVAFLNVKSGADYPPTIVDRDALPIMDRAVIYPSCLVRASLRIYAYGGRGTTFGAGISFGLENVQKLADGPRLKTARGDGSEFGRWDDDDDLSDLLK
jgi:hypothetical protein